MPESPIIVNDEPTKEDSLGREVYARTLQKVAQNCQTPMVIGVHGDWGSGKTSFMRLTESLLINEGVKTVWFNPWLYQFDDSPIIPLLHEIKRQAVSYEVKIKSLKLISLLTSLTGESVLRLSTGGTVDLNLIRKQKDEFDKKYFEAKTDTMNFNQRFQEVINAIVGDKGRLVIFVDDLDRCCPPQCLKVLEAIKLYLNVERCVFIVGMDREIVEQAVTNHYGELKLSGISYMDKIIQLPFVLPPITDDAVDNYLDRFKGDPVVGQYYQIIRKGTAHNPRAIKRFMNTFQFNHTLALEKKLENYKPAILIKLLILQLKYPSFYRYISKYNQELSQIEKYAQLPSSQRKTVVISDGLKQFALNLELIEILNEKPSIGSEDITPYVHLTNIITPILPSKSTDINSGERCPECGGLAESLGKSDSWGGTGYVYVNNYKCSKCGNYFRKKAE